MDSLTPSPLEGTPRTSGHLAPDWGEDFVRASLRAVRQVAGLLAVALLVAPGCSGRQTLLSGSSSPGQMKASLSHLQFENEQLKTEVAKLKEENRSMDDRLVQEQVHNGDLAARLDDARNLLRDRGIDGETRLGTRSRGTSVGSLEEESTQPRTLPAGRSSRKPRKPPSASIPGDLDSLPTAADPEDSGSGTISFRDKDARPPRNAFPDDPRQADLDDDQLRWQPIATDNSRTPSRK